MGRKAKNKTAGADNSGMTQISISLTRELVDKIDTMAAESYRNRSNFIVHTLSKRAREFDEKKATEKKAHDND